MMESLKAFVEKTKSDEKLQGQVAALAERMDKEGMQVLMKAHGVTDENLQRLKEQEQALKSSGKLSDDILEAVAGGGCWSNIDGSTENVCVFMHLTSQAGEDCIFIHTWR